MDGIVISMPARPRNGGGKRRDQMIDNVDSGKIGQAEWAAQRRLGNVIRAAREEADLTQIQLGYGWYSQNFMSRIELGLGGMAGHGDSATFVGYGVAMLARFEKRLKLAPGTLLRRAEMVEDAPADFLSIAKTHPGLDRDTRMMVLRVLGHFDPS